MLKVAMGCSARLVLGLVQARPDDGSMGPGLGLWACQGCGADGNHSTRQATALHEQGTKPVGSPGVKGADPFIRSCLLQAGAMSSHSTCQLLRHDCVP